MADYLLLKEESAPNDQFVSYLAYCQLEFCQKLNENSFCQDFSIYLLQVACHI